MHVHVFFSWQSDNAGRHGNVIGRALARATDCVASNESIAFRPTVDQDTRGVPGTPSMVSAILRKIDLCSVFVADVTLTFEGIESSRKSPNPNVLLELGYALRRLGPERVLIVLDTAFGAPEQLPFDLRGSRAITYNSVDDPQIVEDRLFDEFTAALRLILSNAGPPADIAPPVHLELEFTKERLEQERHEYRLHVSVTNRGNELLRDWAVEVRFPGPLLHPNRQYPVVGNHLPDRRVVMRQIEANHSGPIYPGEKKELMGIDYIMTRESREEADMLFAQKVEAFFFAEGARLASAFRLVRELQVF